MAAAIKFYGDASGYSTEIGTGSGIGFYGASHGASVQVGSYQDTTFMTDGTGAADYGQITNCKYPGNSSGVEIDGGSEVQLSGVSTQSGTLNVRFTYDTAVKTQNCELRIYDRSNIASGAVGVTTQVAQLCNGGSGVNQTSGTAQAAHNGWMALAGSGTIMTLLYSAGESGLSPSGTSTEDDRHDWYVCLSATPTSIGSKTDYGLYVELEYL